MATPQQPVYRPKIELRFSAKDLPRMDLLSKSDPILVVSLSENNQPAREIGKTEKINNNHNPVWQTPVKIEYKFEVYQKILLLVGDGDATKIEPIGTVEFALADLLALRGRPLTLPIRRSSTNHVVHSDSGTVTISGEEVFENTTPFSGFLFMCNARSLDAKDLNGKSDPYYTIQKLRPDNTNPVLVRKSQIIKNTLNPEWPEESIKMDELCNGDVNRPLLFEIWDWDRVGKHDLIGRFTTTVHMILSGYTEYDVINPEKQKSAEKKKKKYENSGKFKINFKPIQTFTFLQYLQSGVQVSLTVAVDFTGSNGSPSNASSLHYLGTTLNEYQEAIEKIGSIVCPYDTDQRFGLFGFGGMYKGSTSHCFPLNGNDNDPEVQGLLGLMNTYREAVPKYSLSGPTNFEKVLKQTRQMAERTKGTSRTYYVLLILTDGQIDDQNETIKEIVESSDDPISIIIVGVGGANFSTMEVLDGDGGKLRHGKKEAQRDVVQFVPFRKHKADPYALAQEVLAEVPRQLISYYESIHYVPQLPVYHPQPVHYAPPPQQPQPVVQPVVQPVQPVVVTTTTTTTPTTETAVPTTTTTTTTTTATL